MSFQKKRKFCDSLLSCLDETNIAVVHKLTKKVLDAASHDCVEADDIPCRGTLRNYSLRLLKTLGTDMDVPLSGGGSMKITVIRPQEAIPYVIENVPAWRTIFETVAAHSPCTPSSPWTLEYHEDEITPGNPMRPDNKRKFHIIYCTFVELDISSWSDGWLPLAVVRSTDAQKFRGGFSGFIATYLRHISLDPKDPLSSIGVEVDFQPDPLVFLAKLGPSVSCQLCKNISADEALVEADDTRYLVEGRGRCG